MAQLWFYFQYFHLLVIFCFSSAHRFLVSIFKAAPHPWRWRQYAPQKRWYLPINPHNITTQMINCKIFTAFKCHLDNLVSLMVHFLLLHNLEWLISFSVVMCMYVCVDMSACAYICLVCMYNFETPILEYLKSFWLSSNYPCWYLLETWKSWTEHYNQVWENQIQHCSQSTLYRLS